MNRQIKDRAKTILSKLMELQDLDRQNLESVLPSSTEGFIQDLVNLVMVEE